MKPLSTSLLKKIVSGLGFNASLPSALFDSSGNLVSANLRMIGMLGPETPVPIAAEEIEALWPFVTEDASGPSLLRRLLKTKKKLISKNERDSLVADAHLKTYRLFFGEVSDASDPRSESYHVIIAEVLRSGDLLNDKASRQALFRSFSHEIRTSVMGMRGYLDILDAEDLSGPTQDVLERLKFIAHRLERVVRRLDDFKTELNLFQGSPKKSSSPRRR